MNFLNIMLCYYISLEAVVQGVAKNDTTENQIDVEIQAKLKHAPQRENSQKVNRKVYRYKLQS